MQCFHTKRCICIFIESLCNKSRHWAFSVIYGVKFKKEKKSSGSNYNRIVLLDIWLGGKSIYNQGLMTFKAWPALSSKDWVSTNLTRVRHAITFKFFLDLHT